MGSEACGEDEKVEREKEGHDDPSSVPGVPSSSDREGSK